MFKSKMFFLILLLQGLTVAVIPQSHTYFIPRNIQKTYHKQTRQPIGLPGVNYWQNRADYQIEAEIDLETGLLSGEESINYLNQSPDTLDRLVFNLYQDIFRKGNSRDWDLGKEAVNDGTEIQSLTINGIEVDFDNRRQVSRQGTKLVVSLDHPIKPKSANEIKVSWKLQIPDKRTVRMGKYSDSIMFVAYWYPQIAVYDDIDGWDMISYQGSVEFYNEFGNFDVTLHTSSDVVVWATGMLQNGADIYDTGVWTRYQAAQNSDTIVPVIRAVDYRNKQVLRNAEGNTWHFKAEMVPDFTFGLGKGMLWDASTLKLSNSLNKDVLISAVYPESAVSYNKVAAYSRSSIQFMSDVMPGIPFPYPSMTTFCNGRNSGGMESPMMANNGAPDDEANLFGLTFHEIAHTYMPFMMGTNEKKYAWMDEGWATWWPGLLVDSIFQQHHYHERTVRNFESSAGNETDVPPMILNQLLGSNYSSLRLASYVRPAMAYHFLHDALGNDLFTRALRYYMNVWQTKHPMPMDFIRIFEMVADSDLSWFFNPWLFEQAYPDLGIKKVTADNTIVVENKGGLPLPVSLSVAYTDGTQELFTYSTAVWKNDDKALLIETPSEKHIREITLGDKKVPDVNRKDNYLLLID